MNLSREDYNRLDTIKHKVESNTASIEEIETFLDLLSGYDKESVDAYVTDIGFSSIDEVKQKLSHKNNNRDLSIGLGVLGGAILLAWLISKK